MDLDSLVFYEITYHSMHQSWLRWRKLKGRRDIKKHWGERQEQAYLLQANSTTNLVSMSYPDWTKTFHSLTDFSKTGISTVLVQRVMRKGINPTSKGAEELRQAVAQDELDPEHSPRFELKYIQSYSKGQNKQQSQYTHQG